MQINPNANSIQLTSTSSLIKNLFRPASIVTAFVKKTSGENVIISVSNNTFRVKSMVPLEEGSWIKGKVFLDNNGTVNLKLIETFTPQEQVAMKAEEFVSKNSLQGLSKGKELAQAFLEQNHSPTPEFISRLAPLVENFSLNQIRAVVWLLTQNLTISNQNIGAAMNFLPSAADIMMPSGLDHMFLGGFDTSNSLDTGTGTRGNVIADILTLNFLGGGALSQSSGGEQGGIDGNQAREIFNLFLNGHDASKALDRFISLLTDRGNNEQDLFNLVTLFQKLNIKNSNEKQPLFWGIFFLDFSGGKRPVEFSLARRYIKHDKKSKGKGYSSIYNLGLFLNPPNLGPMVVRLFYTPPVLSLKFNIDSDSALKLLKANISILKDRKSMKKIQIAKVDFEKTTIDSISKARKLLKTLYNPFGTLDFKA